MTAVVGAGSMLMAGAVTVFRRRQAVFMPVLSGGAGEMREGAGGRFVVHRRVPGGADRGFEGSRGRSPDQQGRKEANESKTAKALHDANLPAANGRRQGFRGDLLDSFWGKAHCDPYEVRRRR